MNFILVGNFGFGKCIGKLGPKKDTSVSTLTGEEEISHLGGWKFFLFLQCLLHFGSFVRQPKRTRKLNTKLVSFSELSYSLFCSSF